MANKTSIVFFTNTPKWEKEQKQFHCNTACNFRIIDSLYQRTKATLQRLALPILEINEDQQKGTDFGERLTNSIQQAFAHHAEQVIVVGNDCPTLSKHDLIKAKNRLDKGQQVIGHSQDGGVYLIGLTREHFLNADFAVLPWQTQQLGQQLEQHLRQFGTVARLQRKNDLDNTHDFYQFLGQFQYFSFAKKLSAILVFDTTIVYTIPYLKALYRLFQLNLRGPPSA